MAMSWYRIYRPQTVSGLHIKPVRDAFSRILSSGSFSHAYLLSGPKGTGKDTAKRRALRELVEQGYTTEIDGYNGHTKYAHKHPYSEAGSLIDGSDDDRWTP
jgi:hypothetical protein